MPGKSSSKTRVQLPPGPTGAAAVEALAVMLSAWVAVWPPESVTLTVKLLVPAAGLPEMTPVEAFSVAQDGSDPDVTVHVYPVPAALRWR